MWGERLGRLGCGQRAGIRLALTSTEEGDAWGQCTNTSTKGYTTNHKRDKMSGVRLERVDGVRHREESGGTCRQ